MQVEQTDEIVTLLYKIFFQRLPKQQEAKYWAEFGRENSIICLIKKFESSAEFQTRKSRKCFFPDGHFHSPVVNPHEVGDYVKRERSNGTDNLSGIDINIDNMLQTWSKASPLISKAPFREKESGEYRYYYEDSPFPHGDALTLFGLIGLLRPKRIIEIGSGFSTACMLDAIDYFRVDDCRISCIEPYPTRLRKLLRDSDEERCQLIEAKVQEVDLEIFDELKKGDFLFIDSTHVLKTGSDVHHEFFHILPRIHQGVFVHFHDCRYPFEYPNKWIFDFNYSWNEIYALRALLTNNNKLGIFLWPTLLYEIFPDDVISANRSYSINPGGSIWLNVK